MTKLCILIIKWTVIGSIILFVFGMLFGKYLFIFEVNPEYKKQLFEACKPQIDVSRIPQTAAEIEKQKGFYSYSAFDMLTNNYEPYKKLVELAISLGDIVDEKHNKSFWAQSDEFDTYENYRLYYDYKGALLFFEKTPKPPCCFCRYNKTGNLIEIKTNGIEAFHVFTPQKHLRYRCYYGSCATLIKYKKYKKD